VHFLDFVPIKEYEVVPRSWYINENQVFFTSEWDRTRLEVAVEAEECPKPKSDFRKYSIKTLHRTGNLENLHVAS
jgi:hypothetical protein